MNLSLAEDFDQLAVRMSSALERDGVLKPAFGLTRRIQNLPSEIQLKVVQRARQQVEQMELLRPEIAEFEKLSILLQHHRMQPVSDEIYKSITRDVAWEIVDFNLNQVYRSSLVFKLGNYSVEEYETMTPWELFARPRVVLARLMELTETLEAETKIVSLKDIAPYIIEESLTPERAQFEIRHEFACPLKDERTGENRAFVSTFRLEPVATQSRIILM